MATVTYSLDLLQLLLAQTPTLEGDQAMPSLARLSDGSLLEVSNTGGIDSVEAKSYVGFSPAIQVGFLQPQVNSTTTGQQFGADSAGLAGGGWLAAFNDTSSGVNEVRIRVFDNQGVALNSDAQISDGAGNADILGNATALANGGAAVSIQKNASATDQDVLVKILSAQGAVTKTLSVETSASVDAIDPSVAQLKNGGLAVAWTEVQADLSQDLYVRRYDASFNAIAPKVLIDTAGSINGAVEVLGLKDGGYALAYEDNGYAGRGGQDISLRIFNADGSARTSIIRANGDAVTGVQSNPHMTELDNGFIALSWDTANDAATRFFTPAGDALSSTALIAKDALALEKLGDLQCIGGGEVIYAYTTEDPLVDGSGSAVSLRQAQFYRVTSGDSSGEVLTGDELGDRMSGGGGDDILSGGGRNDALEGGAGADSLSGGSGFNTLLYTQSSAGVTVNLTTGASSGGDAEGDVIALGEFNGVTGSLFADVITGGAGNDRLRGLAGDDVLDGGAGDDVLGGDQGNDHYLHSQGADIFNDWSGEADWVDYSLAAAAVIVTMNDTEVEQGAAAGDLLGGIEWLTGSAFADTLAGSDKEDKIMGGGGADVIKGGKGIDDLNGNAGFDTLSYAGSSSNVTVDLAAGTASGGDAAGDKIANFERIIGSEFDDILTGNGIANFLTGGLGSDKLSGGLGNDRFVYTALADSTVGATGRDQIKDFDENGADKIDLSQIDASSALDGNNSFSFIGGDAFTAYGQARFFQGPTNTVVEINTEGTNDADFSIVILGLHTLDKLDFVL